MGNCHTHIYAYIFVFMYKELFPCFCLRTTCLGPLKPAESLSLTGMLWPDLTSNVLIVLNKEMLHFEYSVSILYRHVQQTDTLYCILKGFL